MRSTLILIGALFVTQAQTLEKPKNIRVSTWVREDLFAGYIDGDMARFNQGVKKVDLLLAENPNSGEAWAWKASAELFLAVRALEARDNAGFEAGYAKSKDYFSKSAEIVRDNPRYATGLYAIKGGSFASFGDRLPAKYRREAWQLVRENYTALHELQKADFDKMPVHHRGEVMSGLAQAAQRLGENDNALRLTKELVAALPGTPYAVFGKRWLDKPETMANTKLACSTCHDAGRLEVSLNRP